MPVGAEEYRKEPDWAISTSRVGASAVGLNEVGQPVFDAVGGDLDVLFVGAPVSLQP